MALDEQLHFAACLGSLEDVQELLAAGADPAGFKGAGKSVAVHGAAMWGHAEILEELIKHGGNVHATSTFGNTPLHLAVGKNHVDAIHVLIRNGADIRAVNKHGDTILHDACLYASFNAVKVILEEYGGKDMLSMKGWRNKTPLQKAESEGHSALVEYLKQYLSKEGKGAVSTTPVSVTKNNPRVEVTKKAEPIVKHPQEPEPDASVWDPDQDLPGNDFDTQIGNYKLNFSEPLGKGAWGDVYKAYHVKRRESIVALKRVTWNEKKKERAFDPEREIRTFKAMPPHQNIIRLIDYEIGKGSLIMVTELCEEGDVEEYFIRNNPSTNVRLDLMEQATSGLLHLHSQTPLIVHRDIKPQNLLLHKEGGELVLKIADFGFAKLVEGSRLGTMCGSPRYFAPDMLPKSATDVVSYTRECDIFSLGLVFHAMARFKQGDNELKPVLEGYDQATKTVAEVLQEVQKDRLPMPSLAPIGTKSNFAWGKFNFLISCMVQYQPKDRVSLTTVKEELKSIKSNL